MVIAHTITTYVNVYPVCSSFLVLLCGCRVVGLHCTMLPAVGRWRQSECWCRSSSWTQTHLTRQVAFCYLNTVPLPHTHSSEEGRYGYSAVSDALRPVALACLYFCNSVL